MEWPCFHQAGQFVVCEKYFENTASPMKIKTLYKLLMNSVCWYQEYSPHILQTAFSLSCAPPTLRPQSAPSANVHKLTLLYNNEVFQALPACEETG